MILSKNYAILRAESNFITRWNMLSAQNEMIFFNLPWLLSKINVSFYRWESVAFLENIQFPKNAGFDIEKLSVMAFLNSLLDT